LCGVTIAPRLDIARALTFDCRPGTCAFSPHLPVEDAGAYLLNLVRVRQFKRAVACNDDLIAEISIAHVLAISIAGRRGQLDGLEKAVQRDFPEAKLRKSETD
jgi:hypothetical protein